MPQQKIPVTVISGFLGAGKTTLVNHLLAHTPGQQIGIVVNEYGEVGIDGQLIVADDQALIEINNGCVCCTVRADLVVGVQTLLQRPGPPLDRLIIETSGLADPAPVLQTFLADPQLRARVVLDSMVTVIDAKHLAAQREDDIAREQVAFADTLLLNKLDQVDARHLAPLHALIRQINQTAVVLHATRSQVSPADLLDSRRFSLPNLLAIEPDLLDEGAHDHEHDSRINSCSVVAPGTLDPTRFTAWVNRLVQDQGTQLMRMKGLLNIAGEARRFHFHSVHMLLESVPGQAWQAHEERLNRFVFIGRDLDTAQLRDGFMACIA
ncbi:CobW family GTP-binding protein [Pseudomonas sp. SDO528_S397]